MRERQVCGFCFDLCFFVLAAFACCSTGERWEVGTGSNGSSATALSQERRPLARWTTRKVLHHPLSPRRDRLHGLPLPPRSYVSHYRIPQPSRAVTETATPCSTTAQPRRSSSPRRPQSPLRPYRNFHDRARRFSSTSRREQQSRQRSIESSGQGAEEASRPRERRCQSSRYKRGRFRRSSVGSGGSGNESG